MAYLAVVCCHSVNGVAQLHTDILIESMFANFYSLFTEKFNNKTNGATVRRWVNQSNRSLSALFTEYLGSNRWVTDYVNEIGKLRNWTNDVSFQEKFVHTKYLAKLRLAKLVKNLVGIKINPNALFDVHVKRIHEYKRQLLNILGVIHRYLELKTCLPEEMSLNYPKRVSIFSGKAAPAYVKAKNIIRLICHVAAIVNGDAATSEFLKVVFLPNYNVSLAEVIIPASDISEHISTAGTEASGTSNMKFAMNGGLIFGTHDGANIELAQEIGEENMFLFGLKNEEIAPTREKGRFPIDQRLKRVLESIYNYEWASEKVTRECFLPLIESISHGDDYYLVARDFPAYIASQISVDITFRNKVKWNKMCINTIAGTGKFCSDRTIQEYATEIWKVKPIRVPDFDPEKTKYHT